MPDSLKSVERRRVDLPGRGVEIAVLDWGGSGPPALLHHANGFCGALWAPVAEKLSDRFRLLAVDARGHGDSSRPDPDRPGAYRWAEMAEDLAAVGAALLGELGAARFALGLGHSFGGTLSLAAASRHPGLFERVMMVDPVIIPPERASLPERVAHASQMSERARRRRDGWDSRAEAREYLASRELFARWEPRALDLYVAEGLRDGEDGRVHLKCPGAVEGAIFAGDQGMDILELAAEARVPVRILWARQGNFPRALYESMVETMSDAEVVEMDAGHLVVMEEPDIVVEQALRFAGAPVPGSDAEEGAET
ncbi:MAG: alpha/beta fold hydrolase [Myxococcota bacterium]